MIMDRLALLSKVRREVLEKSMIQAGDTVLVAVSGGADSLALLLIMLALSQDLGFRVEAAHYEHGIRGEASKEDARFVGKFCAQRGILCHMGAGDVPALAKKWKLSLEDAARTVRYAFFDEIAARVHAPKIALAHHREDQAETLLLHLAHGCGLHGLRGMLPVQGNRIRPLLEISKGELQAYLRGLNIIWREDATNTDPAYARNFVRLRVMPLLRQLNPRVEEALCRTAEQGAYAVSLLEGQAQAQLKARVKRMPYGAFWYLRGIEPTRYAYRALAETMGISPLNAAQLMALEQARPQQVVNLPSGWRALRTPERMHFLSPEEPACAPVQDDFTITPCGAGEFGDGIRTQAFDAEVFEGAAFRFRRPGDVFAPLGSTGEQKLKQTLQDAGVDRPFRDMLPLLAKGERVYWIVGLRPSRDAAISTETRHMVKVTYNGDLPWEIQGGEHNAQPGDPTTLWRH